MKPAQRNWAPLLGLGNEVQSVSKGGPGSPVAGISVLWVYLHPLSDLQQPTNCSEPQFPHLSNGDSIPLYSYSSLGVIGRWRRGQKRSATVEYCTHPRGLSPGLGQPPESPGGGRDGTGLHPHQSSQLQEVQSLES